MSDAASEAVSIRSLQRMVRTGGRFACLTCYDATTARWLARAGIHVLLVGDTAAEIVLGHPSTVHAPLDFLIQLTAGVKRGAPGCMVMADMPFMSYHACDADGVRNAGRFMTEGMADVVKLELDRSFAPLVGLLARAGVPVVAHIGSRPQHAKRHGGYYAAGKSAASALSLIDDAVALREAGASMLLVEATPAEVTERIVAAVDIPVIGCGAGPACHGQVVVLHDLLGMTEWQPAFAAPAARVGEQVSAAAAEWVRRVASGDLGEHPYVMGAAEREVFERRTGSGPHARKVSAT